MALCIDDMEKGAKVREVYELTPQGPGRPLERQRLGVIVKVNRVDGPQAIVGDVESIMVDFLDGNPPQKFVGTNSLVLHQRADVAALDALKGEGTTRVVADARPRKTDAGHIEKTGKINPTKI